MSDAQGHSNRSTAQKRAWADRKDSLFVRMMLKIRPDAQTGCWHWTAVGDGNGYGQICVHGSMRKAHRAMYEEVREPIPAGMQLDHLCRNRRCVNPSHLEIVTQGENVRRGHTGRHQLEKAFCPQGHPYSGENLYVKPNGERYCRTCRREQARLSKLRFRGGS